MALTDKEVGLKRRELETWVAETGVRIRRYSLDERLRKPEDERKPDRGVELRPKADEAWQEWLTIREKFDQLPSGPTPAELNKVEYLWLELERKVDLIQRDLISEQSKTGGIKTVLWLVGALVVLVFIFLGTHGVRWFDFSGLEPWPEWGPLKYGDVAFWSSFGVLCNLLFLATYYLARRDFDVYYEFWYLSTALRAPFLAVILMIVILEFTEWYGEGTWIETYLLEEGNKSYFIAFMSFCLGLASDRTSRIIRDLAEGVGDFVQHAVARISQRLSTAVSQTSSPQK